MPINTYIISTDDPQPQNLQVEDYELRDVLGKREETLAVKFEELYSSIIESISKSLSHESELTIEVSGSFTLKAEGGAKWLFFNAGGSTSKTDNMKVTLKTQINPHKKP
ncbi:MAG: hypothetical protein PVH61_21390 [Candidatus Aminicenantes bacterium]|jgi:hypothetical protein